MNKRLYKKVEVPFFLLEVFWGIVEGDSCGNWFMLYMMGDFGLTILIH